jgi:hypothetical protein
MSILDFYNKKYSDYANRFVLYEFKKFLQWFVRPEKMEGETVYLAYGTCLRVLFNVANRFSRSGIKYDSQV